MPKKTIQPCTVCSYPLSSVRQINGLTHDCHWCANCLEMYNLVDRVLSGKKSSSIDMHTLLSFVQDAEWSSVYEQMKDVIESRNV